jgi:hypothetical protein
VLEALIVGSLGDQRGPVFFLVRKFRFFEQYAARHQDVDEMKVVDYMCLWGDNFSEGFADQSGRALLAIHVVND